MLSKVRRLPREYHLQVEQGLLRTFGRVMPTLMTLCAVLAVAYAIHVRHVVGAATWLFVTAAASFVAALISTIVFNVPINVATGKWDAANPPPDWKQTRNRWEWFQGLRSWLLLLGFILVCSAVTTH